MRLLRTNVLQCKFASNTPLSEKTKEGNYGRIRRKEKNERHKKLKEIFVVFQKIQNAMLNVLANANTFGSSEFLFSYGSGQSYFAHDHYARFFDGMEICIIIFWIGSYFGLFGANTCAIFQEIGKLRKT